MTATNGRSAPPRCAGRQPAWRRRLCCAFAAAALGIGAVASPGASAAVEAGPRTSNVESVIDLWGPSTLVAEPVRQQRTPALSEAALPTLPHFTGPEFNQLFNTAALPNLAPLGDDVPTITASTEMDDDIRLHAEERGYQRRPVPARWSGLRYIDTRRALQAPAARAWEALVEEAAAHGYDLVLNSAYRGHRYQREVFLRPLAAPYEMDDFAERLKQSAPPGYSKHHTGYAVDITQRGYANFGDTPAYDWISADNFAMAKKHGWIPSYPPDGGKQGPVPEPWEFTYVGIEAIMCFHHQPLAYNPACGG